MNFLISALIGYFLGSIPTAYLILKKKYNLDITESGSGNVGAFNSFDVTKSKKTGLFVFIIDFIKGILSVIIPALLFPDIFIFPAIALFFSVFSHCFNPWLNFNGGKGLATAAGGVIILSPVILLVWVIFWLVVYFIKKDILFANISAIILTLLLILTSQDIVYKYTNPLADSQAILIMFAIGFLTVIFIKHIDSFKEILSNYKSLGKGKSDE